MRTLRHYFISDDLDDLDELEEQLESVGIDNPRIHVLSNDSVGVANHVHLNGVLSMFKQDIIHSGLIGAGVGTLGVILVLTTAYLMDLPDAVIGWLPFIFLSIIVFGFCTWEGGFIGIQKPNYHYRRFEEAVNQGKHVFIVDLDSDHEDALARMLAQHPKLQEISTEIGTPHWVFIGRHWLYSFIDRNLFSHSQVHHKQ